ncbi:MAG: hypothetical protein K2Y71_15235 [Xanthobacteraceae bacterium]|nr:hypothetical protein [Xanthobacteraceae bacterium]
MKEVLDHVPALVKTYGKWPSFFVLLLATGMQLEGWPSSSRFITYSGR